MGDGNEQTKSRTASYIGSVPPWGAVQRGTVHKGQSLGDREFLSKSPIAAQHQPWFLTYAQLFNNVNGETAVKLATELDGVGPIVLKIRLFKN